MIFMSYVVKFKNQSYEEMKNYLLIKCLKDDRLMLVDIAYETKKNLELFLKWYDNMNLSLPWQPCNHDFQSLIYQNHRKRLF